MFSPEIILMQMSLVSSYANELSPRICVFHSFGEETASSRLAGGRQPLGCGQVDDLLVTSRDLRFQWRFMSADGAKHSVLLLRSTANEFFD